MIKRAIAAASVAGSCILVAIGLSAPALGAGWTFRTLFQERAGFVVHPPVISTDGEVAFVTTAIHTKCRATVDVYLAEPDKVAKKVTSLAGTTPQLDPIQTTIAINNEGALALTLSSPCGNSDDELVIRLNNGREVIQPVTQGQSVPPIIFALTNRGAAVFANQNGWYAPAEPNAPPVPSYGLFVASQGGITALLPQQCILGAAVNSSGVIVAQAADLDSNGGCPNDLTQFSLEATKVGGSKVVQRSLPSNQTVDLLASVAINNYGTATFEGFENFEDTSASQLYFSHPSGRLTSLKLAGIESYALAISDDDEVVAEQLGSITAYHARLGEAVGKVVAAVGETIVGCSVVSPAISSAAIDGAGQIAIALTCESGSQMVVLATPAP